MQNGAEKEKCDTKLNIKRKKLLKKLVLKFSMLFGKENKAKFSKYSNSFCFDIKKMKLEKQAYFIYRRGKESKVNYSATKGKKLSSKKLHDKTGF